ncbi:TPA: DNA recombination protein RmuC [Candidatus Uhrbacteria bacterium]|uniref:RmuC-domain protein n=2 Tax=Candidatus Uhriibacteriota TaxID=1752732 RepID=A0A0G1T822_9BACT|nr:MAG: RmuC-domain protein [Candidatus Uhrbacteria bacterium GW2011_GWF2_46_218]KKU41555.1 MAG: RmuC-domain protein [Candidatus Uhrbacteria bacterium GW2011_GWE2_46_68]HBK33557.1 DNA recombination protein RmuC [Candidatus Uhrbacteria bacterium]HCB19488.1 DNA recombination protein RmuC [Candidatus Uhrbacteria bacterium]
MSNFLIFFVISTSILTFLLLLFLLFKSRPNKNINSEDSFYQLFNDLRKELQQTTNLQRKEMQDRLEGIHDKLVQNISSSSNMLQSHFSQTNQIIKNVTEKLTTLDETNKQVLSFSEQMKSLEDILKNPKHRGILGEYWLETLLGQVLSPGQYRMQFDLGIDEDSGQKLIPDAVIFVKDFIIPIDAKFSLENYNRLVKENDDSQKERFERDFKADIKKRIDETSRYIQPTKGTTNFAFMFVPAEGVFHNLITANVGAANINTKNLIEYAFEKKVMIVSPTSFFAYLQTVLLGLRALQIEESVKEIQKQTEHLMKHLATYEEHHNKIGKHLETSMRAYTASSGELKKIDKDIFRITEGAAGNQLQPQEILISSPDDEA